MKSFEQLAQSAYEAACKEVAKHLAEPATPWDSLGAAHRAGWIAAAKQLWAELAAIH